MLIRPYTPADRDACLAVLASNVPEHFGAHEAALLAGFLDDLPGPYYVAEDGRGAVVGCGGIALEEDATTASLCWGIVQARHHRAGIGSALLEHRVRTFLADHPEVTRLRVDTSHKVQRFFERHGFVALEVRPDGHGPGLDQVLMERRA